MIIKRLNIKAFTPLEKMRSLTGFTLSELMIAALVLVTILVGLLASYVTCFDLNETNRNTTSALNAAQEKMAEIRNWNFDTVCSDFNTDPDNKFTVFGMPAGESMGVVYAYVDTEYNTCPGGFNCTCNYDILRVVISVCWRQKGGRVIGEDTNLDGVLDVGAGEDTNGNGQIDSPVQLISFVTSQLYP